MYQKILILLLFIPLFTNAQTAIQLFNGKDLNGWYAYEPEAGKYANATDLFRIEQNMIRLYGNKAGYLMSEQVFRNFQLTVEFRWNTDSTFTRKSNTKNSGVMYLVPSNAEDMLWPKGIQFQIKDGATGDFILLQGVTLLVNGKTTEPGKSVVVKSTGDASNPTGAWNTLVVTVQNGKIKQLLNAKLVNEGSDPSVPEGRILLQYEGFPIDFRKVEIVKLD